MSRFSSFFDALSDKQARFTAEKQVVNDLIFDFYFNALRGKTHFDAIVLSGGSDAASAETVIDEGQELLAIKVRPIDIQGLALPDPCSATCKGNGQSYIAHLYALHPTAYSAPNASDGSNAAPGFGSIVKCYFEDRKRFRRIRWTTEDTPAQANHNLNCGVMQTLISNFTGSTLLGASIIEIDAVGKIYESSTDFIKAMRGHNNGTTFAGFGDKFLAGLAANAKAESAFGKHKSSTIKWSAGDPLRTSDSETRQKRAVNGYCSHGYWQMNVCPGDSEGSKFAKEKGFDMATDEGKRKYIEAIVDEDVLFPWIAARMKSIPEIEITRTGNKSPYSCAYAICFYFENPADSKSKSKTRGNSATKIYKQYQKDIAAAASPSE